MQGSMRAGGEAGPRCVLRRCKDSDLSIYPLLQGNFLLVAIAVLGAL